jgi:hypothetical protein
MSFNNPEIKNPVSKYIEWKSKEKSFIYYDKDEQKNIKVENPIFVIIDEYSTINGFSESDNCGIYSNEVLNTTKEPLNVKTFKSGSFATGLYADIKDTIKVKGGKFSKSVYALMVYFDQDYTFELVNFQIYGAALGTWFEFRKTLHIQANCVGLEGVKEETKGSNTYNVPIFKKYKMNDIIKEAAINADNQLQAFFKYKSEKVEVEKSEKEIIKEPEIIQENNIPELEGLNDIDDLPF